MAEDKMSAEELSEIALTIYDAPDDEFSFSCGAAKRLMRHIASLTSRAEKAEGARDESERLRGLMSADFGRLCATLGVDEDAPEAVACSLNARFADLKREADRMRGALEKLYQACDPFQTEVSRWALGDHDPALSVTWADLLALDIAAMDAKAALSHQADDAGAVTGSEERLREALRPFERFAEYLAGRPGVMLAGATVREETIMPDDEIATVGDASGFATIRARHFLDAAAALSEQQGGK